MKKAITLLIVVALFVTMSYSNAFISNAQENNLDTPEKRAAYEQSFIHGTQAFERINYVPSITKTFSINSAGTATGTLDVTGLKDKVTSLTLFLYIERYDSGRWKVIENKVVTFNSYQGNAGISCSDATKLLKNKDYRLEYNIYAYHGSLYQKVTGNSDTVHY